MIGPNPTPYSHPASFSSILPRLKSTLIHYHIRCCHCTHPLPASLLFLRTKSRCANITSPQLNTENLLHRCQNLLIRGRRSALEVRDDTLCGIAFGRQILLRHFRLHLLSLLGDGIADFLADRVGLDDVVAAVNFGEMLAFDTGFGSLREGNQ
jgi:hypothetical protein